MNTNQLEHPARYFIVYLLAQRRYRAKELVSLLLRQNIPVPAEQPAFDEFLVQIETMQRELALPPGFDLSNLRHAPTANWLREHRIYDMAAREPSVTFAIDVLDQPTIRREMEIMLLGPLALDDIAKRLALTHGLDRQVMNPATVRYYAHYFWNPETVPANKWPKILAAMPDSDDYFAVFKAPKSQVGAAMSVYVATRGGSGIPKESVMFRYVRDTCFMEFIKVAATRYPGMQKSVAMQGLVNSLISAQEQVDMRRGGSAELLDELRRMEPRYDESVLTRAEELPLYTLAAENKQEKETAS